MITRNGSPMMELGEGAGAAASCVRFFERMMEGHPLARCVRTTSTAFVSAQGRDSGFSGVIDADEVAEMLRRHKAGKSLNEIADAMGRSRNAVKRHLRSQPDYVPVEKDARVNAVKGRTIVVGAAEVAEMVRLYTSGMSVTEVGARLGRSESAVAVHVRAAGYGMRPRGGARVRKAAA